MQDLATQAQECQPDSVSLPLYMDVHVQRPITIGLRLRGVDVLTAQEDGCATLEDNDLLQRCTVLGRPIFTRDEDFLAEATSRLQSNTDFSTVIYAHQLRVSIGQYIQDLEIFANVASAEE